MIWDDSASDKLPKVNVPMTVTSPRHQFDELTEGIAKQFSDKFKKLRGKISRWAD